MRKTVRLCNDALCFRPAVSADLIRGAKEKHLKVKGPVRLPTKVRWRLEVHLQRICEAERIKHLRRWAPLM